MPTIGGHDSVEANERRAKSRERLWSSLTILTSGGIAAIAVLRLLSVSRFDVSTALGVLGATATATIVFGAAVIAIPYVAAMLTAQLGNTANWASGPEKWTLWARWALGALFVFVFAPPAYMATVAIPAVFAIAEHYIRKARRKRKHRKVPDTSWLRTKSPLPDRIMQHYREEYLAIETLVAETKKLRSLSESELKEINERLYEISVDGNERLAKINSTDRAGLESMTIYTVAAFLPLLIQYVGSADRPWMPAEILRTQNGTELVGYVVEQDVRWSTVLREPDRSIQMIRTPDILSRTICVNPHYSDDQRPLIARISPFNAAQYAECPGLERP